MAIGMGDLATTLLLVCLSALAWRRCRDVGGKTWALRVVPFGLLAVQCFGNGLAQSVVILGSTFAAYAIAAYKGGWRLKSPGNRLLRATWWLVHVCVYYMMTLVVCALSAGVVRTAVRWSPLAIEADWPWKGGEITGELPFAVEYRRARTFCAEYGKRLRFKSGKRVGLLVDTCGYGPFRVYRMKDGLYCLEDGYESAVADNRRFLRVNVERETVEMKQGNGWFPIPEKGYVRGWCMSDGDLKGFSFLMYSGGDLSENGWLVRVDGTPIGQSCDGMKLMGEIDTRGQFHRREKRLQENR